MNITEKNLTKLFGPCELVWAMSHQVGEAIELAKRSPCACNGDVGRLMCCHYFMSASDIAIQTWHDHYLAQSVPHLLIKRRKDKNGHFIFELWKQRRCFATIADNDWVSKNA